MNQRTQYLIQILDKIGVPLIGAAQSGDGDKETAEVVAGLLGKVVETSISMNEALDLSPADAQNDSLRVALAALAGSLVSDLYAQKGKMPEAADLTRIQAAMSAVLTFGDNFTLSPEHVERLEKLKADGAPVDTHQISIQYVDALIPVINAIAAFPFGQPEQKLIMDVSDRLVKRSAEMREALMPMVSGDDEKLSELALLRAVASVYATCHDEETKRLSTSASEEAPSIDKVWDSFHLRSAMLEAVAKNILPNSDTALAATPSNLAQTEPPPQENPAAPVVPPVAPMPPAAPTDSGSEESGGNPMSFFGAPIRNDDPAPASPPPVSAPTVPPPQEAEQPPVSPVVPPAAPATPSPPSDSGEAGTGGSPMSFFGTPGSKPEPPPAAPATPPPPPVTPAEPPAEQPQEPPATPPAAPPTEPPASDESDSGSDDSGGNPMSFFGKKEG